MLEKLTEAMLVVVVGMGGVLGSLVFFYLVIALINKVEQFSVDYQKNKLMKPVKRSSLVDKTMPDTEVEDEDELTAVITAAVVAATQKEIIIKKIQFLRQSSSSSWSTIGRMNLIGSHDVQKTGH